VTYNALGQLKQLTVSGGINIQYNYPSSGNNGQIASQYDVQSGETITYAYDQVETPFIGQFVSRLGPELYV
jgi:hypothetical protein